MLSNNVFATAKEHVLPSLLDISAEQHSFYQTPTGLGYSAYSHDFDHRFSPALIA